MDTTFRQFESDALARGYDAALERRWEPRQVVDTHRHPFDAEAVVVQGEMWLTEDGATRHLGPGDTFTLPADTPHAERYGDAGATYWVARRARPTA